MKMIRHADEGLARIWSAAEQKQKRRDADGEEPKADSADGGQKKIAKRGDELKEEMDSLIDEIDEVLEENAEEFVKNYVQKGGE